MTRYNVLPGTTKCHVEQPLDHFYKDKGRCRPWCKQCCSKYNEQRYAGSEEVRDKAKRQGRQYSKNNPLTPQLAKRKRLKFAQLDPIRVSLIYAKIRCRRKNIPYDDIKSADIEKPTHCPVFGMELDYQRGGQKPNTASLDRVVPAKGYVKGNVRIISWQANRLKGA